MDYIAILEQPLIHMSLFHVYKFAGQIAACRENHCTSHTSWTEYTSMLLNASFMYGYMAY